MAAADFELIYPDWPVPAHVRAVSTTRSGGFSKGAYESLNLGAHVGDDLRTVERNRAVLCQALGVSAEPRWLDQDHGVTVVDADSVPALTVADASITSVAGTTCAIMTADCLPVLFTDQAGRNVAAAHGGWRGPVGGILENTVSAFGARGVLPGALLAWLGPAIGPSAYEVDAAVAEALRDEDVAALTRKDAGHWQLDLYALARLRLADCGVHAVYGGGFCTFEDSERFFSYRRDGVCGRQAALVWIEGGGVEG